MWYYVLNGQQQGPLTREALAHKLATDLPSDTLVWKEGMDNWLKANELEEFNNFPVSTPPSATPSASINPYAAPSATSIQQPIAADYPLPNVKRANFGLFITIGVAGLLCFIVGYFLLFSSIFAGSMSIAKDEIERSEQVDQQQSGNENTSSESTDLSSEEIEKELEAVILNGIMEFLWCIAAGWLLMFITWIMGLVYVYRAWTLLQPSGSEISPAKAVGFLFIPFFNIYWIFIAYRQWAEDWNALCPRYSSLAHAPRGASGVFLAMAICYCSVIMTSIFGLLASAVLYFIGMKSMCNAINYAADQTPDSDPLPYR